MITVHYPLNVSPFSCESGPPLGSTNGGPIYWKGEALLFVGNPKGTIGESQVVLDLRIGVLFAKRN